MKKHALIVFVGIFIFATQVAPAEAAVPLVLYTNENFFTSEQDAPQSFWRDSAGNFYGVTESGKNFEQRPVVSDIAVRLHAFSIDQARFYVSSFGIITAKNDTVALSIYLARAGWEEELV